MNFVGVNGKGYGVVWCMREKIMQPELCLVIYPFAAVLPNLLRSAVLLPDGPAGALFAAPWCLR